MQLDVSKAFLTPGAAFPFEAWVSLPPQDVMGETVTFDEVLVEGNFCSLEDSIRLEGTLKTIVHGSCALCMEEADMPVQADFSETFRKDVEETDEECFRYEGKTVPLPHMVLTLVMLNLPMRFLCQEGCKGSKELQAWRNDRSKSSCEDGAQTQRPFEALQHLLKKDEEV